MAVAIRQRVAKAGKPGRDAADKHEARFLTEMAMEQRAFLGEFLGVVAAGTWRAYTPPLRSGELIAFERLTGAADAGWGHAHNEITSRLATRSAAVQAEFVPIEVQYGRVPESFKQHYLRTREFPLAAGWDSDRLAWAKGQVVQGLDAGESIRELSARLEQGLPRFSKARLENIATTEATTLYSHGKYARQWRSPYVAGYEYYNPLDERTTDICAGLAGSRWYKPEEPTVPPSHYRCRSELLALFNDERRRESPVPADALPPLPGFGKAPDVSGFVEL